MISWIKFANLLAHMGRGGCEIWHLNKERAPGRCYRQVHGYGWVYGRQGKLFYTGNQEFPQGRINICFLHSWSYFFGFQSSYKNIFLWIMRIKFKGDVLSCCTMKTGPCKHPFLLFIRHTYISSLNWAENIEVSKK